MTVCGPVGVALAEVVVVVVLFPELDDVTETIVGELVLGLVELLIEGLEVEDGLVSEGLLELVLVLVALLIEELEVEDILVSEGLLELVPVLVALLIEELEVEDVLVSDGLLELEATIEELEVDEILVTYELLELAEVSSMYKLSLLAPPQYSF